MEANRYLVLIIDINHESLEMLRDVYDSEGYEVSVASTYEQLLFNFDDEVPDLMVYNFSTDAEVMKDLFLRVRGEERFMRVSMLGLFDGMEPEQIDNFIDIGIDGYCIAPTTEKQLILQSNLLIENVKLFEKVEKQGIVSDSMALELNAVKEELQSRLSDIKGLRDKLSRVNVLDSLTGLFNRAYAVEQLEVAISRFNRKAIQSAIIMCDIDDFKEVNGEYGHNVGDQVLREIASVLSSKKRQQDVIARYSGEKYLIILPDTETEGAKYFAERAIKMVEEHKFEQYPNLKITLTAGVTIYDKTMPVDMVIQMTEDAIDFGKDAGKNQVIVSNELMRLL